MITKQSRHTDTATIHFLGLTQRRFELNKVALPLCKARHQHIVERKVELTIEHITTNKIRDHMTVLKRLTDEIMIRLRKLIAHACAEAPPEIRANMFHRIETVAIQIIRPHPMHRIF